MNALLYKWNEVTTYEDTRRTSRMPGCNCCISYRWKMEAFNNTKSKNRPWRFNELQRDLEGISQKVLTDSLRQMIDDGLVYRNDYHENPPRVDYGLTDFGREMLPIIDALADFGDYYKTIVD